MVISSESSDWMDYQYLMELEGQQQGKVKSKFGGKWAKRVSFDNPLEVGIDGLSNMAVVMKPGNSLSTFLQANAFLDLEANPLHSRL